MTNTIDTECAQRCGSLAQPGKTLCPLCEAMLAASAAEEVKLGERARKLGMTIKSERGTASGYYSLRRTRTGMGSDVINVGVYGLAELEAWIRRFETVLGERRTEPTDDELVEAERGANRLLSEERHQEFLASKCSYCGEPPDALESGVAWVASEGYEFWVHRRCAK